ncbi:MAG: Ig-like domain-containing protein, partial [Acidobacteriota bacterium]
GLRAQSSGDGSAFVLSDQESEVYYRYAVVAGERIKISEEVEVTGNLHSNGTVDLKDASHVTGDVSAVDRVKGKGTVDGEVTPFADPVELPELLDADALRELADRVFEEDVTFEDEVIEDVVFVDGRVRIRGSLGGVGTLIATGDIQVQEGGEGAESPEPDPESRLSLISLGKIDVKGGRALRGVLYAGGDLKISEVAVFEGVLVAGGTIDVKTGASGSFVDFDETPPEIVLVAPEDGGFVPTATPEISVEYSDDFSGVRLDSLELLLDGVDRTGEATVTETGLTFTPEPLAEGLHTLEVAISDHSGNEARETFTFTIDVTPPALAVTEPSDAFVDDTTPEIVVTYADAISGVDLSTLGIAIDGTDLTPGCVVGAETATCEPPELAEGEHTITASVSDRAGNPAGATATVTVDVTPPTITATASPPANEEGWNDTDVTVTFDCQDALSGVESCPEPVTLSDEGAGQVVEGTAFDVAGNSASAGVTVSIDRTPPTFDPADFRPVPCPELTLELRPQVRACFADALAGVAPESVQLSVDGVDRSAAAVVADGCIAWDPPDDLVPGEHEASIAATDLAGNTGSASWCFDVASPALDVAIGSPESGFVTPLGAVDVAGTVDPLADTVEVNGVPATVGGGTFEAVGVPLNEGKTVLTAVASNAAGGIGTASVPVFRDTTPPTVRIEMPRDGAVLTSLQVDVAGLVNDIVTGTTINADDCDVTVNGVPAQVANRSFVVPDLLLKRGVNTLVAEARDRTGNVATSSIQVTVEDRAGQRIRLLAGNNQSAGIREELPDPLIVVLEDADGDPVPGRAVNFSVTRGSGTVRAFPQEGPFVRVTTDDFGQARASFELGSRSGAGNNRVLATAPGFLGEVEFCATASPAPPEQITVLSGANQTGVVERPLPLPLLVLVIDEAGNPVQGVDVTFEVLEGGGSFEGASSAVVTTDLDGLADVPWTLGPDEGINNNMARASFPGLAESAATFTASGKRVGRPADTRVSGVVLDNQDEPVPGATMRIDGTSLVTTTDDQGRFTLSGAPVGSVHLLVDGTTTTRPGVWPKLAYDLTTISGRDNSFDRPIWLLPLSSGAMTGGDEDVTLPMENVPGAELTVFANSVTCPDGSSTCEVGVTQVRGERVPRPPPLGSSFVLAWTIQPPGVQFDPPARLCIPNASEPPGQQVDMFSFDHDQGEFVAIGTATVTPDGTQICSDPGFGVIEGGWHGCVPPPPPPKCTISCDDRNVCTADNVQDPPCACDNPPANEGAPCGDTPGANSCREPGMCEGGSCNGEPKPDGESCDDGRYCTENDSCESGECEGEEIDDEVLDAETIELGAVNRILTKLQEFLNLMQIKGVTLPNPEGSLVFQRKRVCCEEKQGQLTLESSGGGVISLPLWQSPRFEPTIPPWTGDWTVTIFGREIGGSYGIFAQASVSFRVDVNRTKRECQEDVCWSGGVGINGNGTGGIFGRVPNPALPPECGPREDMPCDLLRLEGSGSIGLNAACSVGCEEVSCAFGHNGLTISGQFILLEGTWFEVKLTKDFTPIDPGGLGDLSFTLPL